MLTSCIARVSRDGRDLVIISEEHRIVFIRDFERISAEKPHLNRRDWFWAFNQSLDVAVLVPKTIVSVW